MKHNNAFSMYEYHIYKNSLQFLATKIIRNYNIIKRKVLKLDNLKCLIPPNTDDMWGLLADVDDKRSLNSNI